jgi:hypothetical protein
MRGMNRPDPIALFLSFVAAGTFVVAFLVPFVSSDFDVDLPDGLEAPIQKGVEGFGVALQLAGDLLGDDAKQMLNRVGREAVWTALDSTLGEVRVDEVTGRKISWQQCLMTRHGDFATDWRGCVKQWIAYKAGLPVGDRYILGIVADLWRTHEMILAVLIALFSIAFPLVKVGLCLVLGGGLRSSRSLKWLVRVSKWSMTDVFIVAVVIAFFKAESFNFHFTAEAGVFFFAAGAILSSLAVMRLESVVAGSSSSSSSSTTTTTTEVTA